MKEFVRKHWKTILLIIICWSIGFYMLRITAIRIDPDDTKNVEGLIVLLFVFSVVLILLPFLKSIKIGKIIELVVSIN